MSTRRRATPGVTFGAALLIVLSAGAALVAADEGEPLAPPAHRRCVEQTLLTFPEWFLVFSPAEYADFVVAHAPHDFVFLGHVAQFWQSYAAVTREALAEHYPPNPGYHVMIMVIGLSTTIEYALRSAYETLIGRLSALTLASGTLSAEDDFAAGVAREYVEFIRVRPWYEFDFAGRLARLWREVPAIGPAPLRKWERRYALTTEYGIKAVYGWLIGKATHSAYEQPLPVTATWLTAPAACLAADESAAQPLQSLADGSRLVLLPRYDEFTHRALALSACGADFREIAGNRSVILLSVLEATGSPLLGDARLLFRQPLLTVRGAVLEHLFDY